MRMYITLDDGRVIQPGIAEGVDSIDDLLKAQIETMADIMRDSQFVTILTDDGAAAWILNTPHIVSVEVS